MTRNTSKKSPTAATVNGFLPIIQQNIDENNDKKQFFDGKFAYFENLRKNYATATNKKQQCLKIWYFCKKNVFN